MTKRQKLQDQLGIAGSLVLWQRTVSTAMKRRLVVSPGFLDVSRELMHDEADNDLFGWWLLMMAEQLIDGADIETTVADHASWETDRLRAAVESWTADAVASLAQIEPDLADAVLGSLPLIDAALTRNANERERDMRRVSDSLDGAIADLDDAHAREVLEGRLSRAATHSREAGFPDHVRDFVARMVRFGEEGDLGADGQLLILGRASDEDFAFYLSLGTRPEVRHELPEEYRDL